MGWLAVVWATASAALGREKGAKDSRWRAKRACTDNACGESTGHNSHERLLDFPCSK
jgi:hypothetical protein